MVSLNDNKTKDTNETSDETSDETSENKSKSTKKGEVEDADFEVVEEG